MSAHDLEDHMKDVRRPVQAHRHSASPRTAPEGYQSPTRTKRRLRTARGGRGVWGVGE